MCSYEEALNYLGIEREYADAMVEQNVRRAMQAAHSVLEGAIGEATIQIMSCDNRVKELELIYMADLYSNRGVSAKVSGSVRRLVHSMEQQLLLEGRRRKAEWENEHGERWEET